MTSALGAVVQNSVYPPRTRRLAGMVDVELVGDGVQFAAAKQELSSRPQTSWKGRLLLTGSMSNSASLSVVSGAQLFVLTTEHEGPSLAVAEAMALGVPVIVSAVGGLPELVGDAAFRTIEYTGDTATDERAFAAAIEAFVALSDSVKETWGLRAKLRVADVFDSKKTTTKLLNLFDYQWSQWSQWSRRKKSADAAGVDVAVAAQQRAGHAGGSTLDPNLHLAVEHALLENGQFVSVHLLNQKRLRPSMRRSNFNVHPRYCQVRLPRCANETNVPVNGWFNDHEHGGGLGDNSTLKACSQRKWQVFCQCERAEYRIVNGRGDVVSVALTINSTTPSVALAMNSTTFAPGPLVLVLAAAAAALVAVLMIKLRSASLPRGFD